MYSLVTNEKGLIELSGTVVHQNVADIESQALLALNSQQQMTLCLSNIKQFDSSIVALLLSLQRQAVKKNKEFYILLQQHNLEMLLKSYKVYELFTYLN